MATRRYPGSLRSAPSIFWSVAVALACTAAATAVREALDPVLNNQVVYVFYTVGVVTAAWAGGLLGGILASIASGLIGNYFFVPPRYDYLLTREELIGALSFWAVSGVLIWQVTQWRRAEAALRTAEETQHQNANRLQGLLDATPAVIWIAHDKDCRTITGNRTAYLLSRVEEGGNLSKSSSRAEGLKHYKVFSEGKELAPAEMPIQRVAATGKPLSDFPVDLVFDDGTVLSLLGNVTPILDGRGGPGGAIGAFVDVTARQRVEEENIRLFNEAREANRLKDEFIATLSHEIRTPLNAIVGWTNLLQKGVLTDEQKKKALATIERNARTQTQLLGDMLDISRIIASKLTLEREDLPVVSVIEKVVETMRPAALERKVVLQVSLHAPEIFVNADPARLEQVIWNLLSNALKFTGPDGRIEIAEHLDDSFVKVVVRDTGMGIAPEFLPHVFDRFRQADSTTARTHGGLGLGLAIVKHLVEMHGGNVTAESEGPGTGSTFTVRLPIVRTLPPPATIADAGEEMQVTSSLLSEMNLLVVDDHRDARDVLQMLLSHQGATVRTAASTQEAVEAFSSFPAQLALVDISMPGEDGYSCLRRLRAAADARGERLTVVALTAHAREQDRIDALSAGFDAFLTKPIDVPTVLHTIAEMGTK